MDFSKKKIEKKPPLVASPKKRPEPVSESEKPKPKVSEDKYVRISSTAKSDAFKTIGDRVLSGELKWAYYTIENEHGYHYYIQIKK